jgi:formyl-CoA transferase
MALFQREVTGEGQYVDISMMETSVEQIELALTTYLQNGKVPQRGAHAFCPWGLYSCRDGYAMVVGAPFRHWKDGVSIFEEPRLQQPEYAHVRDRVRRHRDVEQLMQPWLARHNRREIAAAGRGRRMAFGYLATIEEAVASPQWAARSFLADVGHAITGKHRYCDAPFKLAGACWRTDPAPLLGQHTEEVLRQLDESPALATAVGG